MDWKIVSASDAGTSRNRKEEKVEQPVTIMPCLDMRQGRVVKGVHFVDIADAGDPVECARAYCAAGADELALLDITAAARPGKNVFCVRVTNPWRNRLVGDLNQDRGGKAAFTTSPGIDKYDMKPYVSSKAPLIPTGIAKPIEIRLEY